MDRTSPRVIFIGVDDDTQLRLKALLSGAHPALALEFVDYAAHPFAWKEEDCRALIEQSPEPIFIYGAAGILYANQAAARTVGHTAEEVIGRGLMEFVHPGDQARVAERMRRVIVERLAPEPVELRLMHRDGSFRRVEIVSVPVTYNGQPGAQVIGRDITARHDAEERLRRAARHDGLTDLPNRSSLLEHLSGALAAQHPRLALVFLDLDGFKVLNDSLGHAAGDAVLRAVGERLRRNVPGGGFVARFGGDEFVAAFAAEADARDTMLRARDLLVRSLGWMEAAGSRVNVRGTAGVAIAEAGVDANELIRRADLALYHGKAVRRGGVALFDAALHEQVQERRALESGLADAISSGGIVAEYQPILRLRDGYVAGAEALARWSHAELGAVAPGRFVPLAQQLGLGYDLDMMMLDRACTLAAGLPDLSISVNLSAAHLSHAGLFPRIEGLLSTLGLDPTRVALEVTEADVMSRPDVSVEMLRRLRELGVRIHLDDFGTGHSSLAYLQRLPLDAVKIDRYFVGESQENPLILASIINLLRALGLQAIAEGVETEADLRRVRELGCDYAQGWFISRPLTPERLATLLAGHAQG